MLRVNLTQYNKHLCYVLYRPHCSQWKEECVLLPQEGLHANGEAEAEAERQSTEMLLPDISWLLQGSPLSFTPQHCNCMLPI